MSTTVESVTDTQVDQFQADGAICLRQIFDERWLDTLAVGIDKNFADTGPDATYYTPDGQPGGF